MVGLQIACFICIFNLENRFTSHVMELKLLSKATYNPVALGHRRAATGRHSGLSALLKDTSTRPGSEPPTPWLKDGPADLWPTVAYNIIIYVVFITAAGQRWRAEQLESWLAELWNYRLKVEIFQLGSNIAPLKTRRPHRAARENVASISSL